MGGRVREDVSAVLLLCSAVGFVCFPFVWLGLNLFSDSGGQSDGKGDGVLALVLFGAIASTAMGVKLDNRFGGFLAFVGVCGFPGFAITWLAFQLAGESPQTNERLLLGSLLVLSTLLAVIGWKLREPEAAQDTQKTPSGPSQRPSPPPRMRAAPSTKPERRESGSGAAAKAPWSPPTDRALSNPTKPDQPCKVDKSPPADRPAAPPRKYGHPQSPSLRGPFLLPSNGWSRSLHGPWQAVLMDVNTARRKVFEPDADIRDAILRIVDSEEFPQRVTRACVVDTDGWIAFGYSTDPAFISVHGHTLWMGSETGFQALAEMGRFDPLDLALWEGVAREALGTKNWWVADAQPAPD